MPIVPRQRTPVDVSTLQVGTPGLQRALLQTHVTIETSDGRNVFNNNVGNIASVPDSELPVWEPPWVHDEAHPNHERMLRGEAPAAFRAYPTLADGVRDYSRLLAERFPSMLEAKTSREFVQAWRDSGYSPFLNVEATLANFERLLPRFLGTSGASDGDSWLGAVGGALVAGAAWVLYRVLKGGRDAA